jgi:hypothetical protein
LRGAPTCSNLPPMLMDVDKVATLQAHPCEVVEPAIVVLKS